MGQPLKEELEEAKQRPLLGTWTGHAEELREKAGVCWGQPGVGGREEIKDESVSNEACGRWGRGRCISCSFRPLPPPQPSE